MVRQLLASLIVAAGIASVSLAQPAATAPSSPAKEATSAPAETPKPAVAEDPTEQFIQKTKHPCDFLSWGADFRARWEYNNNARKLDSDDPKHEYSYQRYRTRVWTTLNAIKAKNPDDQSVDVNARVAWEFRNWVSPDKDNLRDFDSDEAVLDQLNVVWRNVANMPLTVTAGRQDITDLGDGWLVFDGTPGDGSRTLFFDAVRGRWDFKPNKTTLDLIYIQNTGSEQDSPIRPFGWEQTRGRFYEEEDSRGAIVWLTNKSIERTEVNAYFIYKHDEAVNSHGQDAEIYTFGARIAGDLDREGRWKYRSEIAPQFGEKNGQEILALGYNGQINYYFKDPLNNNVRLSYEYLSGDNPGTEGRNEGFDVLWGRWPRFSELYALLAAKDNRGRGADYTNLHRFGPGWSFNPCKQVEVCSDYYLLFADHNTMGTKAGFGDDSFRGQLATVVVRHKINDHIKQHFLVEFFFPGGYYAAPANDVASFLRYEIVFSW